MMTRSRKIIITSVLMMLITIALFIFFLTRKPYFHRGFEARYPEIVPALLTNAPFDQYLIPDLENTETIHTKSGEVEIGQGMVPQGLALAEDWLIISAYSEEKKYHSVLYVLEKATGEHVKTIVLPETPHLGGLAYDPTAQNLWLTTETPDDTAQLSAISLKQIAEEQFEKTKEPIQYLEEIALFDLEKASFITYHKNNLVVGRFKEEHDGTLVSYPLDKQGLPIQEKVSAPQEVRGADPVKEVVEITKELQGVTFHEDQLLFSQSYGDKSSKLLFAPSNLAADPYDIDEEDYTKEITFPPYMEQIVAADDRLYVLFESSAAPYRLKENAFPIDRVLVFDLPKLMKLK